MKVKGIKRGQTIELLEQADAIPDGTEMSVELNIAESLPDGVKPPLSDTEKLDKLNRLFGTWKDQPDLPEIFAEIDRERHSCNVNNFVAEKPLQSNPACDRSRPHNPHKS